MSVVTNWFANATKQPLNKGIARAKITANQPLLQNRQAAAYNSYLKGIWREIP
jgi:hypothetical protein